ncbi:hypothetical protein SJ05684_b58060 (plasmid) [Sinorhizobium sojae CCBAU 05684]|uniref:Uncharacterized protein n=1 Tax=Sinorhizobium sojae CCBAU 05684 TaxID=716928 RepID=A0A249PLI2_9HYPH|nr:hypothetical protein SJ05684_b58060 [Sinorhizobium sojae CCBAU 05684]
MGRYEWRAVGLGKYRACCSKPIAFGGVIPPRDLCEIASLCPCPCEPSQNGNGENSTRNSTHFRYSACHAQRPKGPLRAEHSCDGSVAVANRNQIPHCALGYVSTGTLDWPSFPPTFWQTF